MRASSPARTGDFTTDRRQLGLLAAYAVVIGVVAGLVVKLLLLLIGLITHIAYNGTFAFGLTQPNPAHWGPVSIVIPVIGGLIVGLIARFGTDKIRGHGIPEAIQSILSNKSVIPARVAFFKPLASALTIGTGGPFGAEGPIIMTGGAIGSLLGQFLRLTAFERRTLLVAGAAGGMSATFGSPIAAVLIAVELLLFEWRPRSFIPVAVASFVAYLCRIPLLGAAPPFLVEHPQAVQPSDFGWMLLVGLAAGVASMMVTRLVYLVEDLYHRLPIHWMWWPAIGGLVVGIGGWFAPDALGVGYPSIDALLNGRMLVGAIVALICVKIVIWVTALSSGTSGGVLAPLLMIGAALGSLLAFVCHAHDPGAWAAIGMAAMLGGTMRAPFMATVFAVETTHAWALMPAAFVGCIVATAFTVGFVRRSILTERLARRGIHVAREYSVHPLELIALAEVMLPALATAAFVATETVAEVSARAPALDTETSSKEYPVVDASRHLIGVISLRIVREHMRNGDGTTRIESLVTPPAFLHPYDRARAAADLMAKTNRHAVAVTDERGQWVGWLTADQLLDAWRYGVALETRRDRIRSWRRPAVRAASTPVR